MFTKFLVYERYGINLSWSRPQDASIVATGSILELVPAEFSGVVLGAGAMYENSALTHPHADIRLLRGPLTAAKYSIDSPLGDPGLVAVDFIDRQEKTYPLGIVPHFVDKEMRSRYPDAHYINIFAPPKDFIQEVDRCEHIITSSLHGVITADSLGVPRKIEQHSDVLGNGFKFRDYLLSVDSPDVHDFSTPNTDTVISFQNNVRNAFDKVFLCTAE
jgi:pyruvyltransferase